MRGDRTFDQATELCSFGCSSVEVEPGHAGQHNEDIADVDSGAVGKPESNTAAAACLGGHAQTLCQQEGLHKPLSHYETHTHT